MKFQKVFFSTAIFSFIWLLSVSSLFAQPEKYNKQLTELDAYYSKALSDWEVPGMAIAIVKDDEVIFSKGYGVTEINTKELVDAETLFPIASNTKAMTVAALSVLVDRGLISWDDRVINYLPYFQLYNPYVTQNMTIRDLLTHRSGLKTFSGDLLWYGTKYSREEVVRRARYLKPEYGFREQFGYSNIMYLAAGEIIPAVTGMSWEDFITKEILKPLGMSRTVLSTNDLPAMSNVATPHTTFNDRVIAIGYLNWDNMGPAGSVISSVNDMSRWLMLQLNQGVWENDTIFSAERSREMWTPQTLQGISHFSEQHFPSTTFRAYGLGWGLFNYLGRKIVQHNGGYDGMISQTCLVPEENLGFVILTNKNSSLYFPLLYKTLDVFLDGNSRDWSAIMLERSKEGEQRDKAEQEKLQEERIKNTSPSLPLEDYTGTYGGVMYGNALVTAQDGQLIVQLEPAPKFTGKLNHWHFNTFRITFEQFPSLPQGFCTFILNHEGKAEEMKIDVPNPDFYFTELEFKRISDDSDKK
ncbi:MAG TPA: serine hydrolase [Bacteroidales bacterium]|nr:serine hydrolase [Bacteroidales bacterium]HPR57812.1 serine hydrolase [Bacteroidales bacterium]HRW96874.1 serine hydrolase [Bacteroidales bacterium]